jgi:hypothetical protein
MNAITTRKVITVLLMSTSMALALFLWDRQPQGLWICAAGALTIPVCWLGLAVIGALDRHRPEAKRLQLYTALARASVPICLAFASVTLGVLGWSHQDGLESISRWMAGF